MGSSAGVEKHSVSMPAETSAAVRARVGSRGFSAYVTGAVRRQLERDALDDLIASMEAEHGPVDERAVVEVMDRMARRPTAPEPPEAVSSDHPPTLDPS